MYSLKCRKKNLLIFSLLIFTFFSIQVSGASGPINQPMLSNERTIIWKGTLEWTEKSKNANDAQKQTWQVPCSVSSAVKDGETEV